MRLRSTSLLITGVNLDPFVISSTVSYTCSASQSSPVLESARESALSANEPRQELFSTQSFAFVVGFDPSIRLRRTTLFTAVGSSASLARPCTTATGPSIFGVGTERSTRVGDFGGDTTFGAGTDRRSRVGDLGGASTLGVATDRRSRVGDFGSIAPRLARRWEADDDDCSLVRLTVVSDWEWDLPERRAELVLLLRLRLLLASPRPERLLDLVLL